MVVEVLDTVVLLISAIALMLVIVIGAIIVIAEKYNGLRIKLGILSVVMSIYMLLIITRYDFVSLPNEKWECEKLITLASETCVRQYVPVIPGKGAVEEATVEKQQTE